MLGARAFTGRYEPRGHQLIDARVTISDGDPMIVAGDFNVSVSMRRGLPFNEDNRDRRVIDRLRRELGVLNAWQVLHPNCEPPQTLRWANLHTVSYHCDGVFVDARPLPRLVTAEIMRSEPWISLSDHNSVVVTFS